MKIEKLVRNWRGHCIPVPDFKRVSVPASYDFCIFGTSSVYMFENHERKKIHIDGLFLPVRPMEEAQQETFLTTSERAQKEFILKSNLLTVFQPGKPWDSDTKEANILLCRESKALFESLEISPSHECEKPCYQRCVLSSLEVFHNVSSRWKVFKYFLASSGFQRVYGKV